MGEFRIYPAIDLSQGTVVRLRRGLLQEKTVFPDSADKYAQSWLEQGARWLHVVNLDGALGEDGAENRACLISIIQLADKAGASIQYGGGIRSLEEVKDVFKLGVRRVMLGTLALESPQAVQEAVARFSAERIMVAVDVRDGCVQSHGWKKDSARTAIAYVQEMKELGVRYLLYTDIQRDGMGLGLNLEMTKELVQIGGMNIIVAGGVACAEDIYLAKNIGASGAVVGRALYDGKVDLHQLLTWEEIPPC